MASRLKEEKLRNYDIPTVKLTKDELQVLKLKAAMTTNGNVAEFVRKAIAHYEASYPQIECCGVKTNHELTVEKDTITVGDQEVPLTVRNVPQQVCQVCGEKYLDVIVGAEIEEIAEGKVDEIVQKTRGKLPKEIIFDVNEWLTPSAK